MLTIIFAILMIAVFGKLIIFAVKAAWGISKILLTVVLLPAILIVLVVGGLIYVALPLVLIIGAVSLVTARR